MPIPNLRHEIDSATQEVLETIQRALADSGGAATSFAFPGLPPLACRKVLSLQVLRRQKRNFMKLATNSLARTRTNRDAIKRLFVEYLQQHGDE